MAILPIPINLWALFTYSTPKWYPFALNGLYDLPSLRTLKMLKKASLLETDVFFNTFGFHHISQLWVTSSVRIFVEQSLPCQLWSENYCYFNHVHDPFTRWQKNSDASHPHTTFPLFKNSYISYFLTQSSLITCNPTTPTPQKSSVNPWNAGQPGPTRTSNQTRQS